MGFIYEETNHYGVEAIVALERYCTPSDEKTCTAATEATRICETYGIPERELLPLVRPLAAAEEYMLEHLTADRGALQFLFTPMAGNTCLAWSLVWDYIQAEGEPVYKYTGHTEQQRMLDVAAIAVQYQEGTLSVPERLDSTDQFIDYMDRSGIPAADKWRFLTLFAHLEFYEQTACRIAAEAAALLQKCMDSAETHELLAQCVKKTRENAPRLSEALPRLHQDITFIPCMMPFNSLRLITNETRITAIVGVFYWTILRLTEKYAANDEHLLGCFKTLGDKSRLDMLKLLKEQERSGQELARELGISQGTVSHHLNVLARDEFIRINKDGSRLRCSLNQAAIENMIDDIKLDDAGIMVITAAGNETSSSYMNSYGTDAPLAGDPDNSVVAAPSVYPANLSIASVEGQEIYANYVLLGDEKITYTDGQTSFLGLDSYVSLLKIYGDVSDDLTAPYDYKDGKCTVCGAADPDYRPEQPENPGQPEKPEQPANPGVKTGDSGVLLYMGLMLLALTGSAWVLRKKRAR